ncbi:MAG: alpha/beta hydrolase [Anaerolineales bacterium]|nr:alpha/beta hydrolase [Anaerolineales bacterium]
MPQTNLISRQPQSQSFPHPLLFVHGAWHGAWCWDVNFLPYFAGRGFAAHALNLRGHGESSSAKTLRWARIKHYVADVAEAAAALPASPIVIGHSMGGLIVQKYLETYHAPAGVLLASLPPSGALRTTFSYMRRHPLAFLKTNLTMNLGPIVGTPSLAQEMLFSETLPEDELASYFAQLQDESYWAYVDMMLLNLPKPERVKAPMLVLGGERDRIFSVDEVRKTAVAYRTAPTFFPMAHNMMVEPGWQDVADTIIAWLRQL